MSRRSLWGRDMQTRNEDLVITDQVRSTKQARHLETTTVKGVLRQQAGGLRRRAQEGRGVRGM
jgi:hypothetical protein